MSKDKTAINELEETNAALEQFLLPDRLARLDSVLSQRSSTLTVVLDGVQNYHNISAVIRSADAFGLMDIHLVGSSFHYSKGVTLGTERWMRIHSHKTAADAHLALKKEGYDLVVLQPEGHCSKFGDLPSMAVSELPFEKRLALVFGNEKLGVSDELLSAASIQAFIPMRGFVESLNISVACAICLFSSTIEKSAPSRRTASLDDAEQASVRQTWLTNSLKQPETVLRHITSRQEQSKD
jgi:tRNA (guanosine-2'-O-)-methyltransferase